MNKRQFARAWLAGLLFLWIIGGVLAVGFLVSVASDFTVIGADPASELQPAKEN